MRTQGKTEVTLKIAALGPMWFYGSNFANLQHTLSQPTRGIYRAYTGTDTRFTPDTSEVQGTPVTPSIRPEGPGEELLEQMKSTVNNRLKQLQEAKAESGNAAQQRTLLLAEAYNTAWTSAYHNDRAIEALIREGDAFVRNKLVEFRQTGEGSADWIGAGPLREAITRLGQNPQLLKSLAEKFEVPVPESKTASRTL
jgi:hypothetical protein